MTHYTDGEIKRIESKRRAARSKEEQRRHKLSYKIPGDPLDRKEKLPLASPIKTGRALCRRVAKEMGVRCVR